MVSTHASIVFVSLTQKHHETLRLATSHLTSMQIAIILGMAPVTIDRRIEAIYAHLDHITWMGLLRLYSQWCEMHACPEAYDQPISDPIILAVQSASLPSAQLQPSDRQHVFEDSIAFDARASWERHPDWLRPGLLPSDLGVGVKLAFMLVGALAIMMIAVLWMAFVDALMSILAR